MQPLGVAGWTRVVACVIVATVMPARGQAQGELNGLSGQPGSTDTVEPSGRRGLDASAALSQERPRVIVSTDIGGSDNDDYQSMVHYLVYADRFDTEGLVSSPPGAGTKASILAVINAYETDFGKLSSHTPDFPTPQHLRSVSKQGATVAAPSAGYSTATEGSDWIVSRAGVDDPRPLWVIVWGSITDVAQAVHDAPEIKTKLRVYSIGSWNTSQDPNARNYLYNNHPDLWWIEANTTFRGMYVGGDQAGDLGNTTFVAQHIRYHGALGDFFYTKLSSIKMGDTPSVLYLLNGDPDDPTSGHWGGRFRATSHGPRFWTDLTDPAYREGSYDGAKTVNVWREAYLRDFQTRMDWADAPATDLVHLFVQSLPDAGVWIGISPSDIDGQAGAKTGFTRRYTKGAQVSLTAPATFNGKYFSSWVRDGVGAGTGTTTVVGLEATSTLTANYSTSPAIVADLDDDGDVDQDDFGLFQRCLSGSGAPHAAGCEHADLDPDGDVDVNDWAVFQPCMAGADRPPAC